MAGNIGSGLFGRFNAGAAVAGAFINALPEIEEEVVVTVYGMPQNRTRMSDLFQVAAAAAFGAVKNRTVFGIVPPAGLIMVEMDYAQSYLRFTVMYKTGLASAAISSITTNGGLKSAFQTLPVFGNVRDSLVGDAFNYVSTLPNVGQTPNLKYAGRTIATRSPTLNVFGVGFAPTPNPKPPVDATARASLVNLVYAALSSPCTTQGMIYPSPTGQAPPPEATGGSQ